MEETSRSRHGTQPGVAGDLCNAALSCNGSAAAIHAILSASDAMPVQLKTVVCPGAPRPLVDGGR